MWTALITGAGCGQAQVCGGEEGRGGVLGKLLPGRRYTRSGEENIRRDTELSDKETSDLVMTVNKQYCYC